MWSYSVHRSIKTSILRTSRALLCRRGVHLTRIRYDRPPPQRTTFTNREGSIEDKQKLRNIGIIAHINAGKTTTTERFLYLAGLTDIAGDVDLGNTVTDYLVQERDRGITITSAAVTFDWLKHRFNLIDTPGHVDFTFEVERSLSVLDGAITLLDASAGVEAQTITVWNQARRYRLPNIIFLNKCDKPQADYEMCLNDLKRDLETEASLIQIPVKLDSAKLSIVDVINRNHLTWTDPEVNFGTLFETKPLSGEESNIKEYKKLAHKVEELREMLINRLTDLDEELASQVIDCEKISDVPSESIQKALRGATIRCQICPVLVGSSFKYIGVQQLLNGVVDYLPSPLERLEQIEDSIPEISRPSKKPARGSLNSAYVFKIMHSRILGPLSYMRVTSGKVEKMQRFKNLHNSQLEQIKKVYRAFAEDLKEIVTPATKDDIVVASGLNYTRTGDVLIDQHYREAEEQKVSDDGNAAAEEDVGTKTEEDVYLELERMENRESTATLIPFRMLQDGILVPKIDRVEPVYFCSIESESRAHQIKLEKALAAISREDPSFEYDVNNLGIITIRGMGKLHLEIIRSRMETEHGAKAALGPIQLSYRETIETSALESMAVNRLINSVRNVISIDLRLEPKPGAGIWKPKQLRVNLSGTATGLDTNTMTRLRSDHRRAIENGLKSALQHGPLLGHPVVDCEIMLLNFQANSRCSLPMVSSVASQCLSNAMRRCKPVLLEPIMSLEVVVPKEHNGIVMSDLSSTRRAQVLSTLARTNGNAIVLRSHAPLATLADYSEFLRIATSGRGSFSMELHSYRAMSDADRHLLVRL